MKYLKQFANESDYQTFKESEDFVLPNVSYIVENTGVAFNPYVAPSSSYIAVDLGLPSGRLWADRNVGASSPEDYGLYFQWGDTVGYTKEQVGVDKVFNFNNYFDTTDGGSTFNKYTINKPVLEASDDAASVNMGSDWRMPTNIEIQELIDNTTPTFIDLQGNEFNQSEAQSGAIVAGNVKGVRFIGANGNSIFVPASGNCNKSRFESAGMSGYLWSSVNYNSAKFALYLAFNDLGYISVGNAWRYFGCTVRGVK